MRSIVDGDRRQSIINFLSPFLLLSKLDYFAISTIFVLGLMRLPEPLWGDQALFLIGGEAIHNGAILYRDFWDVKQPGIYGLYALAGSLFGFNEVGIHLMDLLWMLGLALALRVTLAQAFSRPWIAQILPWIAVGSYFAAIDPRQQMQVESLVGLPMYLAVWFCLRATQQPDQRWRWLMLSGIMGGLVLLLKLIYLPLLVAFWFIYLVYCVMRRREAFLPALWQTTWPLFLGLMLPIVPVMVYWWATGTLGEALYTMLQHPPKMIQALPRKPVSALLMAMFWFVRKFLPLIILSGIAIGYSVRRLDLLTTQMVTWLGLGFGLLLAQSQSWWNYHFLFFLVPLSVLSARGLDQLLQTKQPIFKTWSKACISVCLGGLVVMNAIAIVWMGGLMMRSGFDLSPEGQQRYQVMASSRYGEVVQETAFLHEGMSLSGDIYVLGDPIFYVLGDRAQAVAKLGWIPEMFLPEQWITLVAQLDQAKPPYIFVETAYREFIPNQVEQFLANQYRPLKQSELGIWYQQRGSAG
jgi:hypothetical protein